MPEPSLLLNDGIKCADNRKYQQKSTDDEPRVVKTLGLRELDHDEDN